MHIYISIILYFLFLENPLVKSYNDYIENNMPNQFKYTLLIRKEFFHHERNKRNYHRYDELIMALDAPAEDIKTLATEIEESHPLGRLFDMDVIGTDGMKLSRGTYRKCIICGCQAQECARSRKHSVEELQAKIEELLNQFSI